MSSAHVMAVVPKTRGGFFTITDCYYNFHIFGVCRWKFHPVCVNKEYDPGNYANNMLITNNLELYIIESRLSVKFSLSFK